LSISASAYAHIFEITHEDALKLFRHDLGVVTPKIGVEAAIFSSAGDILLIRRTDDGLYGLPGGWARLCETAEQAVIREVLEETGLEVAVHEIIGAFSCLPGEYDRPHTSYFLLYYCTVEGGELLPSRESVEVGYKEINTVTAWHKDHQVHTHAAREFFAKIHHPG